MFQACRGGNVIILFLLATALPLCFYVCMIILETPEAMFGWSMEQKRAGRRVGFVPTMGYLHDGHMSLVRLARSRTDVVVVSIFVNPTQFGPKEDFGRYPRDRARDESLCRTAGVDVIFYPTTASMYPPGFSTYVVEEKLGDGLCGASRPGHFRGVTTVVAKLFNIVQPDIAVFGEKDAQQLRVIRRMVRDLNIPVEIVPGPTGREADGLAMSSRNSLLNPVERGEAVWLSKSLSAARERFAAGERDAGVLKKIVADALARAPHGVIDYIQVVDDDSLQPLETITQRALLAIAVKFSTTRLIDNTVLGG